MPSNDERRQVAARLRSVSGAPEWATTACCIAECLGEHDYPLWDDSKPLFNRLADLIEPLPERTCKPIDPFDKETKHIVERGLSHYYWPYKGCPECQCDFPQGSNYCPNCGAKVVD